MFADSASHPISQGSTFGVVFSHNFLRSSLFDLIRLCSGVNLLYMYMWNVLSWINEGVVESRRVMNSNGRM